MYQKAKFWQNLSKEEKEKFKKEDYLNEKYIIENAELNKNNELITTETYINEYGDLHDMVKYKITKEIVLYKYLDEFNCEEIEQTNLELNKQAYTTSVEEVKTEFWDASGYHTIMFYLDGKSTTLRVNTQLKNSKYTPPDKKGKTTTSAQMPTYTLSSTSFNGQRITIDRVSRTVQGIYANGEPGDYDIHYYRLKYKRPAHTKIFFYGQEYHTDTSIAKDANFTNTKIKDLTPLKCAICRYYPIKYNEYNDSDSWQTSVSTKENTHYAAEKSDDKCYIQCNFVNSFNRKHEKQGDSYDVHNYTRVHGIIHLCFATTKTKINLKPNYEAYADSACECTSTCNKPSQRGTSAVNLNGKSYNSAGYTIDNFFLGICGKTFTLPTPTRYGYDFNGWERTDQLGTFKTGKQTIPCNKGARPTLNMKNF